MRNKHTLIAIALLGTLHCVAQSPVPSSVNTYQNQAASLLLSGEYQAAITALNAAASQYKANEDWHSYFSCLNQITKAYLSLEDYETAKRMAKEALWESIEEMGRDNDESAKAAHQLAEVYSQARRYNKAEEFHLMGLKIRRAIYPDDHPAIASSYRWLGLNEERQGHYKEAMGQYAVVLAMRTKLLGEQQVEVADSNEDIGRILQAQGSTTEAINEYEKALAIKKRALGEHHIKTAQLLSQLAQLYQLSDQPQKAADYHREAAEVYMQPESEASLSTAEGLLQYGSLLLDGGAYQKAIPILAKACNILKKFPYEGPAFQQYGIALYFGSQYTDALQQLIYSWETGCRTTKGCRYLIPIQLKKGLATEALEWSEHYIALAGSRVEKSHAQLLYGKSLLANERQEEALEVIRDAFPVLSSGPFAIDVYQTEAQALIALNQYDEAFQLIDQAMGVLKHPNTTLEQYALTDISTLKAKTLTQLALQDRKKVANLEAAARQYEFCESMLMATLDLPVTNNTLLKLKSQAVEIYDGLIFTSYQLYSQTQQKEKLQLALEYTEKSKAVHLLLTKELEAIKKSEELKTAAQQLSLLESELLTTYFAGNTTEAIEEQIMQSREKYQASYPSKEIAQLDDSGELLANFQKTLSENNEIAIAYHYGREYLFVFKLDGQNIRLSHYTLANGAQDKILNFTALCQTSPLQLNADELAKAFKQFASLSQNLRRMLLPATDTYYSNTVKKRLLFFPDGPLYNLPFEAISIDTIAPSNFGTVHYMGQYVETIYHYSIRTYVEAEALGVPRHLIGVLAEPSSYPGRLASNKDRPKDASDSRSPLYDLADNWVRKTDGSIYFSPSIPTETGAVYLIAPNLPDSTYQFITSKLYSKQSENKELMIYTGTNYQIDQLVPENHYLLNRWQTEEPSAFQLLDQFLSAFFKSKNTSAAIYQARAQYLEANLHQPLQAHPYFWAGYQLFGKSQPVESGSMHISKYWILVAIGGIILLGWWLRRK